MKAARWHGVKDIRVEHIPELPSPKQGWVKIKIKWCGICGSDLHEYLHGPNSIPTKIAHVVTGKKAPLTLGHEFSGEIVELGKGVTNVAIGDKVTANPFIGCGICYMCRHNHPMSCEHVALYGLMDDGAFTEYINMPADQVIILPDNMSYELAALVEPVAVAVHAVRRGNVLVGQNVAVVGAGPIGLCNILVAKAAGASKVFGIEPAKVRKEYAEKMGAIAIDPTEVNAIEEVYRHTNGLGVDVAIDCVGASSTIPMAVNLTRGGGRTVIVGICEGAVPFNFNDILYFEREICGIHGYTGYFSEFEPAVALMASGAINAEPLITGKIKIDDIVEKGFEELVNNKEANLKIIVSPE